MQEKFSEKLISLLIGNKGVNYSPLYVLFGILFSRYDK